eukprot:Seg711.2 transcript_id=Seg711.2/GoldUCD/mRNA.D3Y31 product="Neuropeptide receptor 22" protein_id=Seg711.2/GoldUCD/D3Y31
MMSNVTSSFANMDFNQSYKNCCNTSILSTNSTMNAGSQPLFFLVRGTAKIFCYVFYGMVVFIGVTGNSIVLYVIGFRKKRRTSSDILILSLACADFLSSVFAPMLMLNELITDTKGWLYGEAMCYVAHQVEGVALTASAWSLLLISLDRYR